MAYHINNFMNLYLRVLKGLIENWASSASSMLRLLRPAHATGATTPAAKLNAGTQVTTETTVVTTTVGTLIPAAAKGFEIE